MKANCSVQFPSKIVTNIITVGSNSPFSNFPFKYEMPLASWAMYVTATQLCQPSSTKAALAVLQEHLYYGD